MSHCEMQEELTCPICMELFSQPRRLPCGHSYCHACIAAMISKIAEQDRSYLSYSRRLACPECRDEIYLDFVEGIEAIPLDFKLSKLVELFQFMKKSDDSDSEGVSTSAESVKTPRSGPVSRDPSTTESTVSSSSSLQSVPTPLTTSHTSARASVVTPGEETISTFTSRDDGTLHATENTSPILSQGSLSIQTLASVENLEERHSVERDDTILPHTAQPLEYPDTQVESSSAATICRSELEQSSNQLNTSDARALTHVDECLEGAVGGVPLPEAPQTNLSLENSALRCHRNNGHVNFENSSEGNIRYIASGLAPSITTTTHPPNPASSLVKSTFCHSQSDIPTSGLCTSRDQGHIVRAHSLPPEEIAVAVIEPVARKGNPERTKAQVSRSSNAKQVKKKKGRSWKSLFVGDSSLSDESSSESDDPVPPRPSASGVKKKRLVTRFLKSIILSDSSSSDWSDDSDYENRNPEALTKVALDPKTIADPTTTRQSLPDISSHFESRSNVIESSERSETENEKENVNSLRNHNNSSLLQSLSGTVSLPLIPKTSESPPVEVTNVLVPSTGSKTSPKEVVPASVRRASSSSETRKKETVPSEATDCSAQARLEDITTASDSPSKDLPETSEKSSERDSPQDRKHKDESKEDVRRMIRDPQELKLNKFTALASLENIAPSHYDNLATSRQVGMPELDSADPLNERLSERISPLPAGATLYDNMNSLGQSAHAARTLYDNISDSDLVRYRLETENALNEGRTQPEIENLKTGYEDMERSIAATKTERDISDTGHNYTGESSSCQVPGPHQPSIRGAPVANDLPAGPSTTSVYQPMRNGPSSLYDNVSGTSLAASQENAHGGSHRQSSTNPLPDMPNYHPHYFAEQLPTSEKDLPPRQYGAGISGPSAHSSGDTCAGRTGTQTDSVTFHEVSPGCRVNDDNNNVNAGVTRNFIEEDDDINDEETDPGARMLQPKRKPRSKLRKFITSLLSLSSSSDEDEQQYYANNTSSSSKSSDW